ncbi:MAG: M1 family peptidase [Calditrichaeota bacterium]|nr:MAG: M1 family peptidase [Calditrichota bacterium]
MKPFLSPLITVLLLLIHIPLLGQRYLGYRPTDSGGPLMPEQAAYDVRFYDLNLRVNPQEKSIAGRAVVQVTMVHPLDYLVLDLDQRLQVIRVERQERTGAFTDTPFERRGNKLWCQLHGTRQPGERVAVRVHYQGRPKEAPAPPWVGGFTWATTADGSPWIATSMQFDGADLWWPCKDHPSDEPDSLALTVTIPKPLILASNGVLRKVTENRDGTRTFYWFVSNPINNYNVALNIAPYRTLDTTYTSVTGETIPVTFYVLPESYSTARDFFPEFLQHLAFYEKLLGPYPFRKEKYSVAQTPHLGMEHQTVIAYGRFERGPQGFDVLHHHELGHEWWGNLVTAFDWRDFWLHEGFCIYMQALYSEELHGEKGYHEYLKGVRSRIRNLIPLAPRESRSAVQQYMIAPEYLESDGDIYHKGAIVLHALRYLIGKEALLKALRRFAYPTPELERVTDGRQCRFATTDDFLFLVESITGRDLDWFFEVYVRQPVPPRLIVDREGRQLHLRWQTPRNLPFPMPVDVQIDGKRQRVEMPEGQATVTVPETAEVVIDPELWVYKWGDGK